MIVEERRHFNRNKSAQPGSRLR
uniref:Uncharacterized protein n=1 Tax=Anguilla anguilla TaxID=7936 RepID=A0A0E9QEY2_ANGAN